MALNYDSLNALVKDKYLPILVNNIFDSNVLAGRMLGKAKKHSSTKTIVGALQYARNSAQGMIGKYEKMNLQVPEPFTAAKYTPITAYQALSLAWEDQIEYTSAEAIRNDIEDFMDNAERSFKKLFAEKMYQLNSAKGTNDIQTLDGIVSDSVTMGGIAVADGAWWVSDVLTTTDFGSTDLTDIDVLTNPESEGFIEKILQLAVTKATFDANKPSVIVMTQHLFNIIDTVASSTISRDFSVKKTGSAVERMVSMGFDAMQYLNIPIIADDELYASQADDNSGRIYCINYKSLHFDVNKKGNFAHKPFAEPVGQNTQTMKILWRGNLDVYNRKEQSVVTGLLSKY